MQELSLLKYQWNDKIASHVGQVWEEFLNFLSLIKTLINPRPILIKVTSIILLHGFAEVNEKALVLPFTCKKL